MTCLTLSFILVGTVHLSLVVVVTVFPMFCHLIVNSLLLMCRRYQQILKILCSAQPMMLLFQIAMAKLSKPHDHVEPGAYHQDQL